MANAVASPAVSAIDQAGGQFPTRMAAPGTAVIARAILVTTTVPSPVNWSNTQPRPGWSTLRIAPAPPLSHSRRAITTDVPK